MDNKTAENRRDIVFIGSEELAAAFRYLGVSYFVPAEFSDIGTLIDEIIKTSNPYIILIEEIFTKGIETKMQQIELARERLSFVIVPNLNAEQFGERTDLMKLITDALGVKI